ncbi:MAG: hypothetical protein KAI73_01890 [Rhodospirillaceae bacterium]|nr:hypothetical protein [Rhodospirillaceae bacterium]
MEDPEKFEITGISQITIHKKWIWIVAGVVFVFVMIVGPMFWVVATSMPATVNTGGYTNLKDW